MRKQKLLQRLVAALATNEGVQPKRTEIWERLKSLTPREVDVLCYVSGGQLNKEIAAELGIAERTIKVHRGHVMEKLGVQSTAQLFPMVLRVLCEILEDIKELGRETAASNRTAVSVKSPKHWARSLARGKIRKLGRLICFRGVGPKRGRPGQSEEALRAWNGRE